MQKYAKYARNKQKIKTSSAKYAKNMQKNAKNMQKIWTGVFADDVGDGGKYVPAVFSASVATVT